MEAEDLNTDSSKTTLNHTTFGKSSITPRTYVSLKIIYQEELLE